MRQSKTVTTSYLNTVVAQSSSVINHMNYSVGIVFESFMTSIRGDHVAQFDDFQSISNISYLKNLKSQLISFRTTTNHKYKRLHYTYLISRIDDRILELKIGRIATLEEKLESHLQEGDVGLISYSSHGSSWNDLLNQGANNLLRLFSHSIFAHVGLIGRKVQSSWEWIHSTLHNDDGRTGVKVVSLFKYLEPIKPYELCVLRTKKSSPDQQKLISVAHNFADNKVEYDTGDAIADIVGYHEIRDSAKFNCGELVYQCIKSVIPQIKIPKKALPSSYLSSMYLEQVYITPVSHE